MRRRSTGRVGQEQETAQADGHAGGGQPVVGVHPMSVAQGQVSEDEQQLRGDHRLDQAEVAEVEGGQLEQEAGDHAEDAEEPDGSTEEEEQQPPAERELPRRRSGRDPLGHRRRGREQARHQGQQDLDAHGLGFPSPAPGPWRSSPSARANSVYRNYRQPARVARIPDRRSTPLPVGPSASGTRTGRRSPPRCRRHCRSRSARPRRSRRGPGRWPPRWPAREPAPPVARAREVSAR